MDPLLPQSNRTVVPLRPYGATGFEVSRIGLGCVTFGREIDEAASFAVMDCAASYGVNLFDTAEAYGGGGSERIVGRWLRDRKCRSSVVVQTKVSPPHSRAHIREALLRSRGLLGVEQVDVYLLHSYDLSTPLDETLAALTESVVEGGAKVVGCSNFNVDQMRAAEDLSRGRGYVNLRVVQPPYSLVAREIERGLLDYCEAKGIGVGSYSPLAAGFLTGKYLPGATTIPGGTRFDVVPGHQAIYFTPASFTVVERMRKLSTATGVPMPRLAMGWALAQPRIDAVLAGARTPRHIENAVSALLSPLPPELLGQMSSWTDTAVQL